MTIIAFFQNKFLAIKPATSRRTIQLYHSSIRKLLQHLGREPTLDDLNDETIGGYLAVLFRSDLSAASVNKERSHLCAIWRLANRLGLVETWPLIQRFTEPEKVPKALSINDLRQLRISFRTLQGKTGGIPNSDVIRAVFDIQYTTAERIGAVSQLRWSDIDGQTIVFRVETRKCGRKSLVKSVPSWVSDSLEPLKVSGSSDLFPGCHGTTKLHLLYDRLFKRAGVSRPKYKSSHLLRSTHATFLHAAGGDATASLGHASSKTTRKSYLDPRHNPDDNWKLLPKIE